MIHTHAKSFESLCELAMDRAGITRFNVPRCGGKWIGQGRFIKEKSACDLVGVVRGIGISFIADAKSCKNPNRFSFSEAFKGREHQREELICAGTSGSVAGLIVESTAHRRVLWLSWQQLVSERTSIKWDDPAWLMLGNDNTVPDLGRAVKACRDCGV